MPEGADSEQLPEPTPSPNSVQNPPLIVIDTDALVQILHVDEYRPLRCLKKYYNIQPAIVEAVQYEMLSPGRSLGRHIATIEPRLQKALGNGTILLLDSRSLPSVVGSTSFAIENQISIVGTRYNMVADYGEAYSHAAAYVLGVPVLTHDMKAVTALERAGETISKQILRVFDLYAFAFQCGEITAQECDSARKTLSGLNERLPQSFLHHSFTDGLLGFFPRLLDGSLAAIGSEQTTEKGDVRVIIFKKV